MVQDNLLKNITGTACIVGLAVSMMNINSTMRIEGNDLQKSNYSFMEDSANMSINSVLGSGVENIYIQNSERRLETEAQELFGMMRVATKEEKESVRNYVNSISKDTGVSFYDLC